MGLGRSFDLANWHHTQNDAESWRALKRWLNETGQEELARYLGNGVLEILFHGHALIGPPCPPATPDNAAPRRAYRAGYRAGTKRRDAA
jgi:hypothetical protein